MDGLAQVDEDDTGLVETTVGHRRSGLRHGSYHIHGAYWTNKCRRAYVGHHTR